MKPLEPQIRLNTSKPLPTKEKLPTLHAGAKSLEPGTGNARLSLSSREVENPPQFFSDIFAQKFGYAPTMEAVETDNGKVWDVRVTGAFGEDKLEQMGLGGKNITPTPCQHWVIEGEALKAAFPAVEPADPDAVTRALQSTHRDLAKAAVSYDYWDSNKFLIVSNMTPGKTPEDVLPPALAAQTKIAEVDEAQQEYSLAIPDAVLRSAATMLNSTHARRIVPMGNLLTIAADKKQGDVGRF